MSIENLNLNKNENPIEQEKQCLIKTLETVKKTVIFTADFLEGIRLVSYGNGKTLLLENREISEVSNDDFNMEDFMYGRRTDFAGIHPRKEFLDMMLETEKMNDRQIIPFIFRKSLFSYEEFVVHEMAHTLFDREYKERLGEYNEKDGITDVSVEYKKHLMNKIKESCLEYFPNLEIERFSFSRQQIAEIFAQLHEREFCRKADQNVSAHEEVFENMKEFLVNPQENLDAFNLEKNRNCTMKDFYAENHTLSLVVAPILEKEFPDFKQRKNLFWNK